MADELCVVDDDPICHYIRAKTLLGTPGRGTDSEAAIRQVLDHRKLARDVDIAAARLLTGPTPAASRVASSNEAHLCVCPSWRQEGNADDGISSADSEVHWLP